MTRSFLFRSGSLLGFLLIWHVSSIGLDPGLLPAPLVVLKSLLGHLTHGDMAYHIGMTLYRVAISFIVAMAIGSLIGILMGRFERADMALDGVLILALNIPALVTIILCYVWFGLTEVAAITAVAVNKIPTVIVTVREGARAVDNHLMDVARVFEVSKWKTLKKVYLPQLYPYFMASARTGLSLIWKIVLIVELLGRSDGVGFQLGTYFQFFDITSILAYTVAFAAIVLIIEGVLVRPLEKRLTRWRQ